MQKILTQVQDLENEGYEFEAAEASFDLLVREDDRACIEPWFERLAYRVNIEAGAGWPADHRSDRQGARRRRSSMHTGQRGRRPGQRPRRGAAQGVAAALSPAGGNAPGRLQGARGQRPGGDGGAGARGDRMARRRRRCGARSA